MKRLTLQTKSDLQVKTFTGLEKKWLKCYNLVNFTLKEQLKFPLLAFVATLEKIKTAHSAEKFPICLFQMIYLCPTKCYA